MVVALVSQRLNDIHSEWPLDVLLGTTKSNKFSFSPLGMEHK